ncbi:DUF1604-domain-containing protein [Xylariaceae sp. FL0255]|nr:DUF1604-domain-containing protein [Xylariaceae sp. FL0255]
MSHYKRNRAQFEADLQSQQSPYVTYGTPLPPLDPEVRDDGSYVPVWKQEVRDERGRKRLHGAFTGGWSAGYFNTVGSKEGWTPSTFVSSRSNRHKDEAKDAQQRIHDLMDEEDLADADEAEKLQTARDFAGLGSTEDDDSIRRNGGLADLFRPQGETMGVKLLRRMGWKEGQGIGPKVRRKANLEMSGKSSTSQEKAETYLFAPENVAMIAFVRKMDRKGLGFEGEAKLAPLGRVSKPEAGESSEDEDTTGLTLLRRPGALKKEVKNNKKPGKGGIGIGILNDTGSDDEDPYEIGPKISYNRVIGGDKKKKKKTTNSTPTTAKSNIAPIPKTRNKNILARAIKPLRKCHDGRLPLDGFVFGVEDDTLTSSINQTGKYPPPEIPPDWKSSKLRKDQTENSNYQSTADAAKASTLDPKSRGAILGEAALPGKSVFDFLSAEARERLVSASGKTNLPQALNEAGPYALSPAERQRELLSQLPELDKATAIAALTRGSGSGPAPYADNDAKRRRYRAYLEFAAGFPAAAVPSQPTGMKERDWLRELNEFVGCARIFKPMTGLMASRFTTASSNNKLPGSEGGGKNGDGNLVHRPPERPKDPAEEAATLGMYGAMTRSVADFYPTRLLCKRFNVKPPAHVAPDGDTSTGGGGGGGDERGKNNSSYMAAMGMDMMHSAGSTGTTDAAVTLDELMRQAQQDNAAAASTTPNSTPTTGGLTASSTNGKGNTVNADVNEALEGKRAQDDVLRAIFGDSSDDED